MELCVVTHRGGDEGVSEFLVLLVFPRVSIETGSGSFPSSRAVLPGLVIVVLLLHLGPQDGKTCYVHMFQWDEDVFPVSVHLPWFLRKSISMVYFFHCSLCLRFLSGPSIVRLKYPFCRCSEDFHGERRDGVDPSG